MLRREAGLEVTLQLLSMFDEGRLDLVKIGPDELRRVSDLMLKYADVPMDFADASLVVAAENLKTKRIFSLDADFHIYRMADGSAFDVVPQ